MERDLDKDMREFFLRSIQRMPKGKVYSTEVKTIVVSPRDEVVTDKKVDPGHYLTKTPNTNATPGQ